MLAGCDLLLFCRRWEVGVYKFVFVYERRGNYWGCLFGAGEQGGWWGFVACGGGAVFCGAFLRTRFGFCEGYGRCVVAADPLGLFLVSEVFGSIVYRYNMYLVSSLLCSKQVGWKKCEQLK